MEPFIETIINDFIETEEKVFREVLRQYLHREPTIEDAKRSSKISHIDWNDKYIIAYDGIELGLIKFNFHPEYGVSFTPILESQSHQK